MSLLNMFRPLKYQVDRKYLEFIYKSFILPVMEYGNMLWGGSYDADISKLESVHVSALRIITGATERSSVSAIYNETKFLSIQERCNVAKLIMFFKIKSGLCPSYLSDLIPTRNNEVYYQLRHPRIIPKPKTRLTTFDKSFIPSTITIWNNIPQNIQESKSLSVFKRNISNKEDPPILYYYGERWPSVHHARMRMGCSALASDLTFNLKVISDPSCHCGADLENAHHFFFTCPKYDEIRNSLQNSMPDNSCFVLKTLLYGDNSLSFSANVDIFSAVHIYINDSLRFN